VTEPSSAVADLQSRWHELCDLDRARAVQSILETGVSLRKLATHLNCSASLLSYLLKAAKALVEDRELARFGEISTRELVRRTGSSRGRSTSKAREAIAYDRECAAIQASHAITKWLDEQKLTYAERAKVLSQAQLLNVDADEIVLGSLEGFLPDVPLDEVIRIFRPSGLEWDRANSVGWHSEWLAHWSLHGILDDVIRVRAFEIASSALLLVVPSFVLKKRQRRRDKRL
jgi:transposase-like protein